MILSLVLYTLQQVVVLFKKNKNWVFKFPCGEIKQGEKKHSPAVENSGGHADSSNINVKVIAIAVVSTICVCGRLYIACQIAIRFKSKYVDCFVPLGARTG